MPDSLSIRRPDDWHVHFRQGDTIRHVVQHTARQFARALAMPNTKPPKRVVQDIPPYEREILAAADGLPFTPYFALYLTAQTTPHEVALAAQDRKVLGYKLYPQGGTTNSQDGISVHNIREMWPVFRAIIEHDMTLMVHGEIPGADMFERERYFITDILSVILGEFGRNLRITFEHITTVDAVAIVERYSNVAATVTAHHLIHNRNAIFGDGHGLSPHHYCLPVLKTEGDRRAILHAAAHHERVFLGTDSAPHPRRLKESRSAPAGCFTAPVGIELYAEAFEADNCLGALEAFASERGAKWYGLPLNEGTLTLTRTDGQGAGAYQEFPYSDEGDTVVCPWSDRQDRWQIKSGTGS